MSTAKHWEMKEKLTKQKRRLTHVFLGVAGVAAIVMFIFRLSRIDSTPRIVATSSAVRTNYLRERSVNNIFYEENKKHISQKDKPTGSDQAEKLNLQEVAAQLKGITTQSNNKTATYYAVFGCTKPLTTSTDANYNFVFTLPLTVLAWWRIGFSSVVILIGSRQEWLDDPILKYVVSKLVETNARLLFINGPLDNRVMLSQVSRLFVTDLFFNEFNVTDYVVTADADIWPLDRSAYVLPQDKSFVLLNAHCENCVAFPYNNQVHRMFPMANVGAHAKDWQHLLTLMGNHTRTVSDLLTYLENIFGDVVRVKVDKGENEGWYIDQKLLTILILNWVDKYNYSTVEYRDRNVGLDRIDRSNWRVPYTLQGVIDVHLLDNLYEHSQMFRVLQLARLMYEESDAYNFILNYFDTFNNLLLALKQ